MLLNWCWRRLLRVPWTTRRSSQSLLKEISPGCSLEGLMLKLKLQYFGHPDVKSWVIWKDPDAGKDWGQEEKGWGGWMASPTWWTWVCVNSRSWWWTGRPGVLRFMGSQRVGYDWATELNWTNPMIGKPFAFLASLFLFCLIPQERWSWSENIPTMHSSVIWEKNINKELIQSYRN